MELSPVPLAEMKEGHSCCDIFKILVVKMSSVLVTVVAQWFMQQRVTGWESNL